MDERTGLLLISTLTHVWSAIRARHAEVPGVILLAAPAKRGNVLGHFAALRWRGRKRKDAAVHEVVVSAEHLDRSPEETLGTLLHEAAHAVNFERGVKDCSRNQYHNTYFKQTAERLGLEVERMPHYGWAKTALAKTTAALYAQELGLLGQVLVHRQHHMRMRGADTNTPPDEKPEGEEDKPRSRSRKATCGCPCIIRVSKKTMSETTIRCERCGEAFQLD